MAIELEGLEFQIEASSKTAERGINALRDSLTRLKNAVQGGAGLKSVAGEVRSLGNALNKVDGSKADQLEKLARALNAFSGVNQIKISTSFTKGLDNVIASAKSLDWSDIEKLEDLGKALRNLQGLSNIRLPRLNTQRVRIPNVQPTQNPTTPQNSGQTHVDSHTEPATHEPGGGGSEEVERTSTAVGRASLRLNGLTTILKGLKGVFSKTFSVGARAIRTFGSAISSAGSKVKSFAKSVATLGQNMASNLAAKVKHTTSTLGSFFASIKRIAMYRLIRSAIKEITKGFSEGLKNLYHWSDGVNGSFVKTMDKLATSMQYLKNSFAAMASPLIETLVPVIDALVDKIVDGMNMVNQFLAAITGKATYTAAKKVAAEWDDASKKTKKATDEMKRYVLGFDELNILGKNKNDSGSSSTKKETDYSGMFETRKVTSGIADFAKQVRSYFENQEWDKIGSLAADKLTGWIDKINWSKLGQKLGDGLNMLVGIYNGFMDKFSFVKLGSNFAATVNGLLDKVNWDELGKAFTKKLNAIGDIILGFARDFEWGKAGTIFGSTLNSLFYNFKWSSLTESFSTAISGIVTALQNAVSTFEWGEHGETFRRTVLSLIEKFPAGELSHLITTSIKGVLDLISPTISDPKVWRNLGKRLSTFVNGLFADKEMWKKAGATVNNTVKGILTFGDEFLKDFDETTAANNLKAALKEIDWKGIAESTWGLIKNAFKKAGNFVDVLFTDESTLRWDIWEKKYVNTSSLGTRIGEKISKAIAGIDWTQFGSDIGTGVRSLFKNITDFFNELRDKGTLRNAVKSFIEGLPKDLPDTIMESLKSFIQTLADLFWTAFSTALYRRIEYKVIEEPKLNKEALQIGNVDAVSSASLRNAREIMDSGEAPNLWKKIADGVGDMLGLNAHAEESGYGQYSSGFLDNIPQFDATAYFDSLKKAFTDGWNEIQQITSQSLQQLVTLVLQPLNNLATIGIPGKMTAYNQKFKDGWYSVNASTATAMTQLQSTVLTALTNLDNVGIPVKLNSFTMKFKDGWYSINAGAATAMTQLQGTVLQAFVNLENTLPNRFKGIVNSVVRMTNSMIGKVQKGTNNVIRGLNNALSFSMSWQKPDWAGGGSYWWNWRPGLSTVQFDRISELARGGILQDPTLFGQLGGRGLVGGEAGNEAVLPLEQHTEWMDTLAAKVRDGMGGNDATMSDSVRQGVMDATARQNDLLREQNDLLRKIYEKEFTADVSTSSILNGLNRRNIRDGKTVVAIGT